MKKFRFPIFLFLILLISGCGEKEYSRVEFLMDTVVEIKVYHRDGAKASEAISSSIEEMKRVEEKMSRFLPTSEVSTINKIAFKESSFSSDAWIPVSDEIISLLQKAIQISDLTKGSFDITIYPLLKIWKFEGETPEVPKGNEIRDKLRLVNYKNMVLQNGRIKFVRRGMGIDLGGIAKGYAVDAAVRVLKEKNIGSAMVNAGGDIYVLGRKKGKPWRIGIRNPRKNEEILGSIALENSAIVTSGDYERFFFSEGKRYHHILNPQTGYPADKCQSVTILAKATDFADGLATGIFVLGPKEGMDLIEHLKEVEGIIVDKDGKVSVSSGLASRIEYVN